MGSDLISSLSFYFLFLASLYELKVSSVLQYLYFFHFLCLVFIDSLCQVGFMLTGMNRSIKSTKSSAK